MDDWMEIFMSIRCYFSYMGGINFWGTSKEDDVRTIITF